MSWRRCSRLESFCFLHRLTTSPTPFTHTNAPWLVEAPYLGSQAGRRWVPAGRGRAERRRAEEAPAAGACSSGPRPPWRRRRAGRVQIGSLVWRHQDLQRKGWHCWWRREPSWWPRGMMGPKKKTNHESGGVDWERQRGGSALGRKGWTAGTVKKQQHDKDSSILKKKKM